MIPRRTWRGQVHPWRERMEPTAAERVTCIGGADAQFLQARAQPEVFVPSVGCACASSPSTEQFQRSSTENVTCPAATTNNHPTHWATSIGTSDLYRIIGSYANQSAGIADPVEPIERSSWKEEEFLYNFEAAIPGLHLAEDRARRADHVDLTIEANVCGHEGS